MANLFWFDSVSHRHSQHGVRWRHMVLSAGETPRIEIASNYSPKAKWDGIENSLRTLDYVINEVMLILNGTQFTCFIRSKYVERKTVDSYHCMLIGRRPCSYANLTSRTNISCYKWTNSLTTLAVIAVSKPSIRLD